MIESLALFGSNMWPGLGSMAMQEATPQWNGCWFASTTLTHRFGAPDRYTPDRIKTRIFCRKTGVFFQFGETFQRWFWINTGKSLASRKRYHYPLPATPSLCLAARVFEIFVSHHAYHRVQNCEMGCCMDNIQNNNDDDNTLQHSLISIYLPTYLPIYLSVYLSICLSIELAMYLSISLYESNLI